MREQGQRGIRLRMDGPPIADYLEGGECSSPFLRGGRLLISPMAGLPLHLGMAPEAWDVLQALTMRERRALSLGVMDAVPAFLARLVARHLAGDCMCGDDGCSQRHLKHAIFGGAITSVQYVGEDPRMSPEADNPTFINHRIIWMQTSPSRDKTIVVPSFDLDWESDDDPLDPEWGCMSEEHAGPQQPPRHGGQWN